MINLNKYYKVIIFPVISIVIICCIIIVKSVFFEREYTEHFDYITLEDVEETSSKDDLVVSSIDGASTNVMNSQDANSQTINTEEAKDILYQESSRTISSFKDIQKEKTEVEFDNNIEVSIEVSDDNIIKNDPSQTITANPELLEQARKNDEKSRRILTGLFRTELDIKQEKDEVLLNISLFNISEEDLKIDFDVGCEFDVIVTNSEGNEIYNRFNGERDGVAAISHHKLAKGEKLTFSYFWNYNDNNGNKVTPGKYSITVQMNPTIKYKRNLCHDELMAVEDIEIIDSNLTEQN